MDRRTFFRGAAKAVVAGAALPFVAEAQEEKEETMADVKLRVTKEISGWKITKAEDGAMEITGPKENDPLVKFMTGTMVLPVIS